MRSMTFVVICDSNSIKLSRGDVDLILEDMHLVMELMITGIHYSEAKASVHRASDKLGD